MSRHRDEARQGTLHTEHYRLGPAIGLGMLGRLEPLLDPCSGNFDISRLAVSGARSNNVGSVRSKLPRYGHEGCNGLTVGVSSCRREQKVVVEQRDPGIWMADRSYREGGRGGQDVKISPVWPTRRWSEKEKHDWAHRLAKKRNRWLPMSETRSPSQLGKRLK